MNRLIKKYDFIVCLTDNQIVKTLNELIGATKKIWREIELNVSNNVIRNYSRIFNRLFLIKYIFPEIGNASRSPINRKLRSLS